MSSRIKLLTGALIIAILATVFGFHFVKQRVIAQKLAAYQAPPIAVTTLQAEQSPWTARLVTIGEITANDAVDVTPQLGGQVRSIHFKSGDTVAQGDLLLQLDDQLEQDELEREVAKVELAQLDVDRYTTLVKENSASQATLDRAAVNLRTDQASAHAIRTKIDYMAIKAPFPGRLGIRQVNVGQFVQPGTAIVNLQDISVLFVDFSLPEADLPKLSNGLAVELQSDAYPDKTYHAKISAISPQIDPNSRNVDIRATLANPGTELTPGMFAKVTVVTDEVLNAIQLPSVALAYSLYGDMAYVIGDPLEGSADSDDPKRFKVERRSVEVLARRDDKVAIGKGLKPGEEVVSSNQQQLKDGTIVIVNNSVALDSSKVTGQ
ncbi:MAG: efflux RND transporter periplasmic adaptor subunit [Halioglobus sp.]